MSFPLISENTYNSFIRAEETNRIADSSDTPSVEDLNSSMAIPPVNSQGYNSSTTTPFISAERGFGMSADRSENPTTNGFEGRTELVPIASRATSTGENQAIMPTLFMIPEDSVGTSDFWFKLETAIDTCSKNVNNLLKEHEGARTERMDNLDNALAVLTEGKSHRGKFIDSLAQSGLFCLTRAASNYLEGSTIVANRWRAAAQKALESSKINAELREWENNGIWHEHVSEFRDLTRHSNNLYYEYQDLRMEIDPHYSLCNKLAEQCTIM